MIHNNPMRTTLTLKPEAYEIAQLYAKGRGVTLGTAVSELVLRDTSTPAREPSGLVRAPNGLLVFAPRGRTITSEMVKEALEEDDFA